ncbi:MAG: peptidase P60, partial [Rhizobiales bacterium]|nr:peptidase P60 [Hyphomicrobiales bacterium]
MSENLDPRRHVYRDDLAAMDLKDKVQASEFVDGETRRVIEGIVPLRHLPGHDQPLDTEALFGETFTLYDIREGWAWG